MSVLPPLFAGFSVSLLLPDSPAVIQNLGTLLTGDASARLRLLRVFTPRSASAGDWGTEMFRAG